MANEVQREKRPGEYKIGDKTPSGATIGKILANSVNCMVFTKENGVLGHLIHDENIIQEYGNKSRKYLHLCAFLNP